MLCPVKSDITANKIVQNKDYQLTIPAITSKVRNQRWNQRKRDGNNDNQIAILLAGNVM